MLLETKNISNQSLMVMLLKWHDCHNWRATSTRKPKKEWKFECISWIKKPNQLLFLPKYNKTQVNSLLNVSMVFLFIFISTLTNIRQKWSGYFYDHMNKKGYFYSHESIISCGIGIPLLARLFIPHYQKTWKIQCKLREINAIH